MTSVSNLFGQYVFITALVSTGAFFVYLGVGSIQKILDDRYDLLERKTELLAELKETGRKLDEYNNALEAAGITNFVYYEKGKPFDENTGQKKVKAVTKRKLSLGKMQEASKRRYGHATAPKIEVPVVVPEPPKMSVKEVAAVLNSLCVFYDPQGVEEVIKADRRLHKKQAAIIREYTKQGRIPSKTADFSKMAAYAAAPRPHFSPQNPTSKSFERPPAVYSNSSPYGIASEMLLEQLRRSG